MTLSNKKGEVIVLVFNRINLLLKIVLIVQWWYLEKKGNEVGANLLRALLGIGMLVFMVMFVTAVVKQTGKAKRYVL